MGVIVWLILALVAGITEAATVSLVSVWFALGAVVAAVAAWLGAGIAVQIILFLVVSVVLMILTAPICRKFRLAEKVPTNVDRLIGCVGVVTEEIDPIHNTGEVKVKGQKWSVQARGDGFVPEGKMVIVEDISGAHLVVSVINDNLDKESEE